MASGTFYRSFVNGGLPDSSGLIGLKTLVALCLFGRLLT